ncbi:MAG: TraR/DksA C4-type zinc finger protein [Planctomycetaceae bacterium]|jgi:RNA polymerase-binding transcription factor DksA|nr:TraR/DksA C4-type zinc finger protein [Planctomycetaceae bacterium]
MKKIKKKNPVNNKKTTKNTPPKKGKQPVAHKKITKSIANKKVKKKVKKKNIALKPKTVKSLVAKSKKKTVKILKKTAAKKTTIKKINSTKPTNNKKLVQNKSKLLNSKNNSIIPVVLKPVVEKDNSISTQQSLLSQKTQIKPNIELKEVKPEIPEIKLNSVTVAEVPSASPTESMNKQLSEAELNGYRQKLIAMRARLRGDVSTMTDAALNKNRMDASGDLSAVPIHMADVGTDNFEQEQTLSFMQNERGILVDIEEALGRIKDGTYGICEGCGTPIPKVRLNFIPYANMCVKCAELLQHQEEEG